ncbi:MAG: hypothetical protein OSB67_08050 [Alphaproteobacteria bacterium]|nr:hypothetical protein [Alphaproteobacteria bacterium]
MLLDKLEEENRATQRRRLVFVAGFAGVALFLGLLFVAVVFVWPSINARSMTSDVMRGDMTPVAKTKRLEIPTAELTENEAQPAGSSDVTRLRLQSELVPDALTPDGLRVEAGRVADYTSRDQFKDAIGLFQKDIEPELTNPAFAEWNTMAQRDLLVGRDEAFELFVQGKYGEALTKLNAVSEAAKQEISARDDAFQTALNDARSAFEVDSYEKASVGMSRALQLKPDSQEAKQLDEKITKLPAVLTAIGKAAVARVENNLEKEDRHLTTLLSLDPSRTDQAARRAEIRTRMRGTRFANQVVSGMKNVLSQKLSAARENLKTARGIYADRRETKLLSEKIDALADQLQFEKVMAVANAARTADDWEKAEDFYARAGALVADDPNVVGGYHLAGEINQLRRELGRILATPARLAYEPLAQKAAELVSKAKNLAELSPFLSRQSDKVADLIKAYDQKVSIRILSDGLTRITVRGVGQVGATTDRTIQLRPGSYTFEGARAGFRSKLIQVDILPGIEGLVVEIYPNEPV